MHNVPELVPSDESSLLNGLSTSETVFSNGPLWLLILGGAVVLIGYGNMEYYVIYVRYLQFILLMPGIAILL